MDAREALNNVKLRQRIILDNQNKRQKDILEDPNRPARLVDSSTVVKSGGDSLPIEFITNGALKIGSEVALKNDRFVDGRAIVPKQASITKKKIRIEYVSSYIYQKEVDGKVDLICKEGQGSSVTPGSLGNSGNPQPWTPIPSGTSGTFRLTIYFRLVSRTVINTPTIPGQPDIPPVNIGAQPFQIQSGFVNVPWTPGSRIVPYFIFDDQLLSPFPQDYQIQDGFNLLYPNGDNYNINLVFRYLDQSISNSGGYEVFSKDVYEYDLRFTRNDQPYSPPVAPPGGSPESPDDPGDKKVELYFNGFTGSSLKLAEFSKKENLSKPEIVYSTNKTAYVILKYGKSKNDGDSNSNSNASGNCRIKVLTIDKNEGIRAEEEFLWNERTDLETYLNGKYRSGVGYFNTLLSYHWDIYTNSTTLQNLVDSGSIKSYLVHSPEKDFYLNRTVRTLKKNIDKKDAIALFDPYTETPTWSGFPSYLGGEAYYTLLNNLRTGELTGNIRYYTIKANTDGTSTAKEETKKQKKNWKIVAANESGIAADKFKILTLTVGYFEKEVTQKA